MTGRRKAEARRISTLVKVALLDIDLAISRYFEVEGEKLRDVIGSIDKALVDVSIGKLTRTIPTLPKEYVQIEHDFRQALAHLSDTFGDILDRSGQITSTAS